MARTDAVNVINEVVARMRALEPRLKVTYEPGWEGRGNGMSPRYVGGIVHHTASNSSPTNPFPTQRILRDGRSDLQGPLCNFAGPVCGPDAPWIHVMAAYPANHAGASGGRSMGPLPVTSSFNGCVLGLEIDYIGSSPMAAGQLYAAQLWARAVADVLAAGNLEYVRGHFETSITGKWDPGYAPSRSLDMGAFRAAARQIKPGGRVATLDQDDKNAISVIVRDWANFAARKAIAEDQTIDWGEGRKTNLVQQTADNAKALVALQAQVSGLLEAIRQLASGGIDLDAVTAASERGATNALSRITVTVNKDA